MDEKYKVDSVPTKEDARYTSSGIPIKVFYNHQDVVGAGIDEEQDIGLPGQFPFTRGIYPTGYRYFPWQQQNIMGFDLPEDTNARQKLLMKLGASSYRGKVGMNIAFDNAVTNSYDSDDPRVQYEVGRGGVSVNSVQDLERLLEGLQLDNMNIGFIVNYPMMLGLYVALADKRGVPRNKLSGVIRNNLLSEMICVKSYVFPPRHALRLMVDCIKFCIKELPAMNFLSLDGYDIREAGSTAVQEMAFPISKGIDVIRACQKAGLNVDQVAPNIAWFISAHNNFFEEIAKIRAARRLWARILQDKFGARSKKSFPMKIHMQTAGSTLTAQEPLNNSARVAIQALVGVFAGVQSLSTASYDEVLGIPTEGAVRVAIKTQKIIEHEMGGTDVVDPLGGSYYLECLTTEMEKAMMEYIDKIEAMGGFVAAMENGYIDEEIANASLEDHWAVESCERVIVGLNKYVEEGDISVEVFSYNPRVLEVQKERLRLLREQRDEQKAQEALDKIREAAASGGDLMPLYIEAAKADVTLGEMKKALHFQSYETRPILGTE